MVQLTAVVASLLSAILCAVSGNVLSNGSRFCETKSCISARDRIREYMDPNVDPCDDFYYFSCGSYIKIRVIPDSFERMTQLTEVQMRVDEQVQAILETPIANTEIKLFRDTKKFYQSCMNLSAIENLGMAPLMNKIRALGGWPVLGDDSWNENSWSFESVSRKMFENGFANNFILSLIVEVNLSNTSRRIAKITMAELGLNREYFARRDERYEAYKNLQVDLVELLGSSLSREEIGKKMAQVLDFENFLAEVPKVRSVNPMTIRELQEYFPYIAWLPFLNSIMPNKTQFTSRDTINNGQWGFLRTLGSLLRTTPKEVVANYIMWRVALDSLPYLNQALLDRHFVYKSAFTGQKKQQQRQLWCVIATTFYCPQGTSALYVRRHFRRETKEKVKTMINYIINAFKENVESVRWMDNATKRAVLVKARAMRAHAGAADELYDNASLERFYGNFNVDIDSASFYESMHRLRGARSRFALNQLNRPVIRDDWTEHKSSVLANAVMNHARNEFEILAAVLQDPIYNENLPQYMNYGSVGNIIGHELTHAFDNAGSKFDENGNLKNWWSDASRKNFTELNKCFIDQFNSFTEPITGLRLNGTSSQAENIADSGGFKFAYKAYEKWAEEHGEEQLLPGIALNQRQLFWVSAAQSRCSISRKEYLENLILVKSHPPHQFRVTGSIGNQPEFSRDFNCPSTSPMNFETRCSVW